MTTADFKLKGSTIPVVVLELENFHPIDFENSLKHQIDAAPQFFHQAPVLINLEKLSTTEAEVDFTALVKLCFSLGIQPVAFKSVPDCYLSQVERAGLAILSEASTPVSAKSLAVTTASEKQELERITRTSSAAQASDAISEPVVEVHTVIEERLVHNAAMIIDKPVRSGQQIYAKASDLVVLGNVSEGAEVIADGNIHIYGILRGRALAGAQGDEAARIMCRVMDAELVSIAGNFLPSDAIDEAARHQAVQIRLIDGSLKMQTLTK